MYIYVTAEQRETLFASLSPVLAATKDTTLQRIYSDMRTLIYDATDCIQLDATQAALLLPALLAHIKNVIDSIPDRRGDSGEICNDIIEYMCLVRSITLA